VITLNKLKAGIPRCEQTRPISLLSNHSKLFEKILLDRVHLWASIYQEIKNNLVTNAPTLAIYVNYGKAYGRVWYIGLMVKLYKLGIPLNLLKMIESWLDKRTAFISFGQKKSELIKVRIGLPQGSALSPFIFVVFHSDLVNCFGAHSGHLFADDLSVLIRAPLQRSLQTLTQYLEIEGTKICGKIAEYSNLWKQPINLRKSVAQIFYSQVKKSMVSVSMLDQKLEIVDSFKYLGFTWTNKLSLKPTVNNCLENIQKSLNKLKHRAPFVEAKNLFVFTREDPLENYVKRYIKKRLKNMYATDLGSSMFLEDVFFWDNYRRESVVYV
jgi:hypothetical protein